jgi:nucleoside-diphosphate-sugar epimerase
VHLSSVAVYGTVPGPIDERTPIDSDLPRADLYARSKREAEEVVRGIEQKRGLPVTILRPSAVYGERDRLLGPALVNILRLPIVPLFGPATNALPIVYAGNVAAAVRLALEASRGTTTYDVGFDGPLTQRDLFGALATGMGMAPRFASIPAWLVRGGGELLARLGVKTPGAAHLAIDRVTHLALSENPYPSALIRSELGWKPPHPHGEALERTGRWLAAHLP